MDCWTLSSTPGLWKVVSWMFLLVTTKCHSVFHCCREFTQAISWLIKRNDLFWLMVLEVSVHVWLVTLLWLDSISWWECVTEDHSSCGHAKRKRGLRSYKPPCHKTLLVFTLFIWMCASIWMQLEARKQLQVPFFKSNLLCCFYPVFIFFWQNLSLAWILHSRLHTMVREPQGFSYLHLLNTRTVILCLHGW